MRKNNVTGKDALIYSVKIEPKVAAVIMKCSTDGTEANDYDDAVLDGIDGCLGSGTSMAYVEVIGLKAGVATVTVTATEADQDGDEANADENGYGQSETATFTVTVLAQ